jgi:hypothetical protein
MVTARERSPIHVSSIILWMRHEATLLLLRHSALRLGPSLGLLPSRLLVRAAAVLHAEAQGAVHRAAR